jgi:hypothetical protein
MVVCGGAAGLPTSEVQEVDAWPVGDQGEYLATEVDRGCLRAEGGRRRQPLEEVADLLSSSMAESSRERRQPGRDVRCRQRETMGS